MIASSDAKEYVVFWNYWRWQYLSRNKRYRKDYMKFSTKRVKLCKETLCRRFGKNSISEDVLKTVVSMLNDNVSRLFQISDFLKNKFDLSKTYAATEILSPISILEDEMIEDFMDTYRYQPVDPGANTDSESILLDVQAGKLDKDIYLPDQMPHCFHFQHIDDAHLLYEICLNKSIEQIIAEIQYIYNASKNKTYDQELSPDERWKLLNDADSIYYEIAKQRLLMQGLSFDVKDEPRAIGLWLWDNISQEYGENDPPHKAYSMAISSMKEKFDIDSLGYSRSENGVFRNMLHRTSACIKEFEVLSMKGEPRKKKTRN